MKIAIIGHGKSVEGRGWGKKIDSCDMVIRCWDWHWQLPVDYGTKYDIGLLELSPSLMVAFTRYNVKQPRLGWIGSALHRAERVLPPNRTEVVSQERWTDLGQKLGGLGATGKLEFTRGTIAACWAIEYGQSGDHVILVGFDNVRAGKALPVDTGFSKTYLAQPSTLSFRGYKENAVKYGHHDFSIEHRVMAELAKYHGVLLYFADDMWLDDSSPVAG